MALDSNQLKLLNQKLVDIIGGKNRIIVNNNQISVNGKTFTFESNNNTTQIFSKTVTSR